MAVVSLIENVIAPLGEMMIDDIGEEVAGSWTI